MTPEQRRAEIDRKYPFQVDVPYLDDWDAARERMAYLITYIGSFDMYVVAEGGRACVRHCFAIDADAELFRAFPPALTEPVPVQAPEPHQEPPATSSVAEEVLRVRVEMLTTQLEREQETVADLRARLDAEAAERRRLTALLTYQEQKSEPLPTPTPTPTPTPRRWFWWGGRKA